MDYFKFIEEMEPKAKLNESVCTQILQDQITVKYNQTIKRVYDEIKEKDLQHK